jgi:eukaryotic-like serine/threonine-protein kinase
VTGPGWGRDPFGGSAFGSDPFSAEPASAPPPATTPPSSDARPTNTLATLSVIFAFVFAPAGAALGHLGLHQINRTGERGRQRAVAGIALSYTIITITVIALVVWTATGDDPTSSTAAPMPKTIAAHPTRAATPTTTSSGTATWTPIGLPAAMPGRTVGAGDLPAVLLGIEQINAILTGSGAGRASWSDLAAQPATTALVTSPGLQGTVDPADCAPTMITGSEADYRDSGYQAVYSVTMTEPGSAGAQAVTQTVLAFPDADSAQQALGGVMRNVQRCAHRGDYGPFAFTAPDGGATEDWAFNDAHIGDIHLPDDYYSWSTLRSTRSSPDRQDYGNLRAVAIRGNAVVEIAVRGVTSYDEAANVIVAVRKNLS